MNNFGHIKDRLLGHLTRNGLSMKTEGGTDMVAAAINSALVYIQRKRDFEWNKHDIKVHCNPKGNILTQAVLLDNNEKVQIKRINQAYGTSRPSLTGAAKVDYLSKSSQVSRETYGGRCSLDLERVIHSACDVFVQPTPNDPYDLYFEAVIWLPPFVNETDTNFLLTYGMDFMVYRSLQELNFYIKEDQRFSINMALLREAENGLIQWDMSLLSPTETEIDL